MRKLAILTLFAVTPLAGWTAVGPGGIPAAMAYPPNPCEEQAFYLPPPVAG